MNHEELRDALAAYALGTLEPEGTAAVEAHVSSGCRTCGAELLEFEAAAARLGSSVDPATPPERLRPSILRAAAALRGSEPRAEGAVRQVWKGWGPSEAPEPLAVVRAGEGAWEEALEGVQVKRLSFDRDRRLATMLIRMQPGTRYPSHRHGGPEECYVLEGDLHVGDVVMQAGDFQRAEIHSVHVPQYTETGCLLLVTSSLDDELI